MGIGKRVTWSWAAWALTAGGCAALVGLDDGHYLQGSSPGEAPCRLDEVGCSDNRPARCNERGAWEPAAACPEQAPVCRAGQCVTPPSCAGLGARCGPGEDESCCATRELPGGTFFRSDAQDHPATVGRFLLDRFEVTVGRFRAFVAAYPGSKPRPGAGEHPAIPGSGWRAVWDGALPEGAEALRAAVMCDREGPIPHTWTEKALDDERLPMSCLSWYVAFAFCAWDGGRLPTEAEWQFAAAGGDEGRVYPWSEPPDATPLDTSYAVYLCTADGSAQGDCLPGDILRVGSRSPKGDGRWGHADLAGSLWEWALDVRADYVVPCDGCAALDAPAATEASAKRVIRGGCFKNDRGVLLARSRGDSRPEVEAHFIGLRCARSP